MAAGEINEYNEPAAKPARELIEGGAEIAGAAVGGALGLIGGPIGIAAGATGGVLFSRVLKRVGHEVASRLLGPRQEVRIGGAFAIAEAEINERLEHGDVPRRNDWFAPSSHGRSQAEELLEGVLLAAANEYENARSSTWAGSTPLSRSIRPSAAGTQTSSCGWPTD